MNSYAVTFCHILKIRTETWDLNSYALKLEQASRDK